VLSLYAERRPFCPASHYLQREAPGNRMARRSSQLAIVRDPTREAQSVINPAEAEIRAIENEITSGRDQPLPAFLNRVVDRVCSLTHADGVAVAVCDEWGVVCRASTGDAPGLGSRLQADSGLTRECLESGHVVICEDTEKDCRVDPSIAKSLRLRSAVVVPLRTRNSVLGVLEVLSSRAFAFDRNHVASLQRIAAALGPPLASGRLEAPAASVLFPGSERPEEQKSKVPRYLAAGAVLVLLILLFFLTLHRTQGRAPSASAMPPTSVPVRTTQPTVGQQGTQAEASGGERVTSPSSSRPDLLAPRALPSSPTPQPSAESTVAQSEKPLTAESGGPEVIRPPIPAIVIVGAPPGAQIFVDDHLVASINPNGQASISTLAAGQHRLHLRLNGYLDYDDGIEVRVGQTSTVTAKLEPFDLPVATASTNAPIVRLRR
jgi:hypothetical protein